MKRHTKQREDSPWDVLQNVEIIHSETSENYGGNLPSDIRQNIENIRSGTSDKIPR